MKILTLKDEILKCNLQMQRGLELVGVSKFFKGNSTVLRNGGAAPGLVHNLPK